MSSNKSKTAKKFVRKATFNREVQGSAYVYTPVNKRAKSLGKKSLTKKQMKSANGGKFRLYFYAKNGSLRQVKV